MPQAPVQAVATPDAPAVMQLVTANVAISGSTHLVAPGQTGDLMDGTNTVFLSSGDIVQIDRDQSVQSARGPNKENLANQAEDNEANRHKQKHYKWFKVTKVKGKKVKDNSYLRDETFIYEDQATHLEDDSLEAAFKQKLIDGGMTETYIRAHGLGGAAQITAAQAAYQGWLKSEYSDGEIMDLHRSVGFEYEFANYANSAGTSPGLAAHVGLGSSTLTMPMFGQPFLLETDSKDELEAVTPPFLIADSVDGGINKDAANRIYQTYKNSLANLRDSTEQGTALNSLNYTAAGLGDGWQFTSPMNSLYLAGRSNHRTSKRHVYSQMNLSLTAEEIAAFTETTATRRSNSYGAITAVYTAIQPIIEGKKGDVLNALNVDAHMDTATVNAQVKAGVTNIARGLSGLVSIPSILAQAEGINQTSSLFTSVKEYCGMWLKDSIGNIVDNSLSDADARQVMLGMITAAEGEIAASMDTAVTTELGHIREGVKGWLTWPFAKDKRAEAKLNSYRNTFSNELTTTLADVKRRLAAPAPTRENLGRMPAYGKEKFVDQGLGVRKDTYVNIASGDEKALHLAELRNDLAIDSFLGVKRRQREGGK